MHHFSFPETYTSPDGTEFLVRPIAVSDRDAFCSFFGMLPERDRLFFQEDLSNPVQAERWVAGVESGRTFALIAVVDDKIVGQVSLYRRLHGWTRLVGYILVAVRPDFRGRGVAGYLVRRIVELAVQMGLDKVVAETLTGQRRERRILETHGFRKEAILRDHATDMRGNKHNVVLLSHNVYDLWRRQEDMIIDKEFEVIP
ncbi:MAG: GNAT family N-acetyltransferase [Deltaproteobacteria bacterium]|nr:GNAT family N-acetyltransferase [Deltaproteobacteria bacterium]